MTFRDIAVSQQLISFRRFTLSRLLYMPAGIPHQSSSPTAQPEQFGSGDDSASIAHQRFSPTSPPADLASVNFATIRASTNDHGIDHRAADFAGRLMPSAVPLSPQMPRPVAYLAHGQSKCYQYHGEIITLPIDSA